MRPTSEPIRRSRPRRRPPTWGRGTLLVLSLLTPFASAAATNTTTTTIISAESTHAVNISSTSSATFHLVLSSASTLFVTLSLCTPPESLLTSLPAVLPLALFVSNSSSDTSPGPSTNTSLTQLSSALTNGFANVSIPAGLVGAWIGVWAPDDTTLGGSGGGTWGFQLSVSATTPLSAIATGTGFAFDDADAESALLTTAAGMTGTYRAVVLPTTALTTALGASVCAVGNSSAAVPQAKIVESATTRGWSGGSRTQFSVAGLAAGTNYTAWLVEMDGAVTRMWSPVAFATKTGNNCRLVYDLDFCPDVAYAVPSPPNLPTANLTAFYNSTLAPSIANFKRTLTTFPCSDISMGAYSFISTCDDCAASYLTWLCATTLPRCTDPPSNVTLTLNTSDSTSWDIPSSYQQIVFRQLPNASRTPDFGPDALAQTFPALINATSTATSATPFPYAEVPPCLDVCDLVDARCPPMFAWQCPVTGVGGTGTAGYGQTQFVSSAERMANDPGGGNGLRAQDRFGNVFCNSLGTDMLAALQQPSASAGHSLQSPLLLPTLLASLVAVSFPFFL